MCRSSCWVRAAVRELVGPVRQRHGHVVGLPVDRLEQLPRLLRLHRVRGVRHLLRPLVEVVGGPAFDPFGRAQDLRQALEKIVPQIVDGVAVRHRGSPVQVQASPIVGLHQALGVGLLPVEVLRLRGPGPRRRPPPGHRPCRRRRARPRPTAASPRSRRGCRPQNRRGRPSGRPGRRTSPPRSRRIPVPRVARALRRCAPRSRRHRGARRRRCRPTPAGSSPWRRSSAEPDASRSIAPGAVPRVTGVRDIHRRRIQPQGGRVERARRHSVRRTPESVHVDDVIDIARSSAGNGIEVVEETEVAVEIVEDDLSLACHVGIGACADEVVQSRTRIEAVTHVHACQHVEVDLVPEAHRPRY